MTKIGLGFVCDRTCIRQKRIRPKNKEVKTPRAKRSLEPLELTISKKIVKERDGNCCRYCGRSGVEVHHIDYRSQMSEEDGLHEPHNLISLCQFHHQLVHTNKKLYQPLLRAVIWLTYSGQLLRVTEVQALLDGGRA